MDTLRVRRLRAHYRLASADDGARERLDRVLRSVVSEALGAAVERAGIPAHEEVCIRRVSVPAKLRLGKTDAALADEWSRAMALAIRSTIDRGGPDVVRYPTRAHAVADVVAGVADGDLRRAWAWRQLGLWSLGESEAPSTAASAAVRALTEEPRALPALLAAAARSGALARLAPRWAPSDWTLLARAALRAADAHALARTVLLPDAAEASGAGNASDPPANSVNSAYSASQPDPSARDESVRVDRDVAAAVVLARRLATRSVLAPALRAASAGADAESRRAIAVLVLLEAEPAVVGWPSERVRAGVAEAARVLAGARAPEPRLSRAPARRTADDEAPSAASERSAKAKREAEVLRRPIEESEVTITPDAKAGSRPGAAKDFGPAGDEKRDAEFTEYTEFAEETVGPAAEGALSAEEDWEEAALPDARARGRTRHAGVLYLLNLIEGEGIVADALAHPGLAGRPLRWTMHALARQLAPVEARDPAALAFAGLGPDRAPPSEGEEDATEAETEAVRGFAARLAERARARLESDEPADAVLAALVARDAEVVADPGWIEAHIPLEQVETPVRRAGLDRDPGYLPWLGVVVRLAYA